MTNFLVAYIIVSLRCFTDAIYIAHFCCEICKENFREVIATGNLAVTLCTFLKHLLNFLNCLPIPQIVVLIFTPNHGSSTSSVENILHALCLPIVFQYIVRTFTSFSFHGYQSARGFILEVSLTNCLINAFKFIFVGHVVGSCLYISYLKQMASYASSLVPSYTVWKCLFMMSILILQVFFFSTIILNIENFVAPVRRLLENLQRLGDVDRLTNQDNLPHELRRRVREAEQFWLIEAVNEEELVRSFSLDLQNELWHHFSQGFHFFTHLEADLRMAIYTKLKQNVYRNNSCIIVPDCPIDDVIFIVSGQLESIDLYQNKVNIAPNNICGAEILTFYLHDTVEIDTSRIFFNGINFVSRSRVRCISNVKAFSLKIVDIKELALTFERSPNKEIILNDIRFSIMGT